MDNPIATEFDIPFTVENVLAGYRQGIFPMGDDEDDLIYWFRPDPRAILPLEDFHIPRSLQRAMDNGEFEVTANRAFTDVMIGCGEGRPVWITDRIHDLYNQLHELKKAHSVE
nr:leucyl/phenylalanyl-tRNA--protein transferase family protein [Planctomycetota bacterium]